MNELIIKAWHYQLCGVRYCMTDVSLADITCTNPLYDITYAITPTHQSPPLLLPLTVHQTVEMGKTMVGVAYCRAPLHCSVRLSSSLADWLVTFFPHSLPDDAEDSTSLAYKSMDSEVVCYRVNANHSRQLYAGVWTQLDFVHSVWTSLQCLNFQISSVRNKLELLYYIHAALRWIKVNMDMY